MAGLLSKGITLSYKTSSGSSYSELVNLQSIPDLGAAPEQVDVTCLKDGSRMYIDGIKDFGSLEFGFLYTADEYDALNDLVGSDVNWKVELAKEVSTSTAGASFTFTGKPSVRLNGAGVNEALGFTLSINLSSDITFADEA